MAKDNKDVTEAPVNFGANLGLMLDLYDDYLQDPSSVPDDLQVLFNTIKMAKLMSRLSQPLKGVVHRRGDGTIKRIMRLIDNIRQYGHLKADIYPVNAPKRTNLPKLEIEEFNLDKETLENVSNLKLYLIISKIYMIMLTRQLKEWRSVIKGR